MSNPSNPQSQPPNPPQQSGRTSNPPVGAQPIPEEVAQQIQPIVQSVAQMMVQFSPKEDPFWGKVTSEHLTEAIKAAEKKESRAHDLKKFQTWVQPVVTIAGVALVLLILLVFCWLFLAWNKAEKIDLIIGLILGFASGAFGGYGFAKLHEKKKEE